MTDRRLQEDDRRAGKVKDNLRLAEDEAGTITLEQWRRNQEREDDRPVVVEWEHASGWKLA